MAIVKGPSGKLICEKHRGYMSEFEILHGCIACHREEKKRAGKIAAENRKKNKGSSQLKLKL